MRVPATKNPRRSSRRRRRCPSVSKSVRNPQGAHNCCLPAHCSITNPDPIYQYPALCCSYEHQNFTPRRNSGHSSQSLNKCVPSISASCCCFLNLEPAVFVSLETLPTERRSVLSARILSSRCRCMFFESDSELVHLRLLGLLPTASTEAPLIEPPPAPTEAPLIELPPPTEAPLIELPPPTEAPSTEPPPPTVAPLTEPLRFKTCRSHSSTAYREVTQLNVSFRNFLSNSEIQLEHSTRDPIIKPGRLEPGGGVSKYPLRNTV